MRRIRIVIEKHPDTFVAYPLAIKGVCVGEGDTFEEALACVSSMLKSHVSAFGDEVLEDTKSIQEVFLAEARISA